MSATQVGKTFAVAVWLLAAAWGAPTRSPWSAKFPSGWYTPTYKQSVQGQRVLDQLARSAGILESGPKPPDFKAKPPPPLVLSNNQVIEFRTWDDPENLAGDTIARFVADEAGLLVPRAQSIISTRRSATLGPGRYIGNPGILGGPFRRLCMLGQSDDPGFSFHHWTWRTKYEELLRVDPDEAERYLNFVEEERRSIDEIEFIRLYKAAWTEDENAVFTNVEGVTDGPPVTMPSEGTLNGDRFVIGVDVGQRVDYFAAVLLGINRYRADYLMRFRGIGYPEAAVRVKELQDRTGAPVVLEINGPGIAVAQEFDRLRVRYIPFTTSAQSKQEIISNLAADFSGKRIKLAKLPPLQYELQIYKSLRLPSGQYRYSAPSGEHDDTVIALALAAHARRTAVFDMKGYGWMT